MLPRVPWAGVVSPWQGTIAIARPLKNKREREAMMENVTLEMMPKNNIVVRDPKLDASLDRGVLLILYQ